MATESEGRRTVLMALVTLGVIGGVFGLGLFLSNTLQSWFPEERPAPKPQITPSPGVKVYPAPRLVMLPKPTARRAKPAARKEPEWRGRPSRLPPHEVLMRRAQRRYPANLPPVPKAGSKFYVLKRGDFKDWANRSLAEQGARFQPNFSGGRPQGMVVTDVSEGSFFRRLGFHKGDVLLRVNGKQVASPGHAQKMYKQIAVGYRNLTLEFERGGRRHIVDFSIR